MHVHVFIHAKHLTLNAKRQKEWRETKKEQPRRISEEGVTSGECIQEKAQKKTEFHAKHRDATRQWTEGKRIHKDNQINHTPIGIFKINKNRVSPEFRQSNEKIEMSSSKKPIKASICG